MELPFDITFHPGWWNKYAGIDFSQPFFDEPEYRMDCDVRMRKTLYEHFGKYGIGEKNPERRPLLGSDLLAAGYLYSELFGCEIVYQADNSPQVVCRELDAEQIAQLKAPNLDSDPVWARTQKQIAYLGEKYGRVESYINLQGIQNVALDLMGQELFLAYYTDEDEVRGLLSEITKMSLEIGRRLYALTGDISGGVTGIVRKVMPDCYLTSNCSVEMVSQKLYEDFLLEHDRTLAKAFPCFGIHHCGKSMEHVAEGYAKVPELKFVEVGAGSDVRTVAGQLPGVWLNLRYSAVELKRQTAEEIEACVNGLLDSAAGATGGVSVSCVGIDRDTPEENVLAFLEACNRRSKAV